MKLLALVLCFVVPAAAQDGGVALPRAQFVRVPENARIIPSEGLPAITLPAGYFLTELSFKILDAEMQRLQDRDRIQTKSANLDIPLQGWLIGMSATALLSALLVFSIGWYLRGSP